MAQQPKDIKLQAAQPKTKLAFDMSQPLKYGFLKKKGEKMKLTKERFYVLYPNFLVYYTDAQKWKFDKTVGRLESRKGAFKLTGGKATDPARDEDIHDCKFPFVVYAPDVSNNKMRILVDATSSEERASWMEAISKAALATEK